MKLTVIKRIAYVVLGSLACFVLVFNPAIIEWWNGSNVMLEAMPKGMESIRRGPASIPVEEPAKAVVNWWTTTIIPGVLYIGKRFVDWFFDNVMPTRSAS